MAVNYDFTLVDTSQGITSEMGFEEVAAKRMVGLAEQQYEKELKSGNVVVSNNQFYGRLVNMVRQTAEEKGVEIIPLSQPKSNEKKIFRSVTEYYMKNMLKEHEGKPLPVQHMVELYTTSWPLIVDLDRMQADLEKKLKDLYREHGESAWENPELTIVPEHPGRYSFEAVHVDEFAGYTIRETADNIVNEVITNYGIAGIGFMEKNPEDREDNIELEKHVVNVADMHRAIYDDFVHDLGGVQEYKERFPEKSLYELSVEAVKERCREFVLEDSATFLKGNPLIIVDRKQLRENLQDTIDKQGFDAFIDVDGIKVVPATYLPEYNKVYNELKDRSFELVNKSSDMAGSMVKGLSLHNEMSNDYVSIDLNGGHYEVPLNDNTVSIYKLKNNNGHLIRGEKVPVDRLSELVKEDALYRVVYASDMSNERIASMAAKIVDEVYKDNRGIIDKPSEYVAFRLVNEQDAKLSANKKSGKVIAGIDTVSILDVEAIDKAVTEVVMKSVNNKMFFDSAEPIVMGGREFGSVSEFAYKFHEYQNDEGEYVNEGVGLKEMIAKTSFDIVNTLKQERVSELGHEPVCIGHIDESYKDNLNIDLTPVYANAERIVDECIADPKRFKNVEKDVNGWSVTTAAKEAELSSGELSYTVSISPDYMFNGHRQLVVNDIVNQYLDKYIIDFGYQACVNELDDLIPSTEGHIMFTDGWKDEVAALADYQYDAIDGIEVLASVTFPDGVTYKRNLEAFPENFGFNPDFIEAVRDENQPSGFKLRARATEEERAYPLITTYEVPLSEIGLRYEAIKIMDKNLHIERDEYGRIDVVKTNELRKSLGLELYVDGEKKSLNNSSFNSYEKYRNDYIDEVNQVLEEQLLREFEDNQFNVSADVRDRNAGGKEYAGGVLDLVNVDDFVPVENFYTRKVVFMGYEQMKDEGLEILGKNMGNQSRHLRNPGDEISFAPLNDKDKAPLLAAILKERIENFNDDKVVLGHVLKYTDSVYDSLGSFYKNISDGAFKFSSLNNCVYSRDAVVDAMLGQQLRLMAVRFDMIEHGSSVEQVNEIPDKVIAKTYSMKYFCNFTTEEMLQIVALQAERNNTCIKGSVIMSAFDDFKTASKDDLGRIIKHFENDEGFKEHRFRLSLDDLKNQYANGNISLTKVEASKLLKGAGIILTLKNYVPSKELKEIKNLDDAYKVSKKVFADVRTFANDNALNDTLDMASPIVMSLKDREFFADHGLTIASDLGGLNEFQYAKKVISMERDKDVKLSPSVKHAMKFVYPARELSHMTKYDTLKKYDEICVKRELHLNQEASKDLKDYVRSHGITINNSYTNRDYEKDSKKLPVRKETMDIIKMYCLESSLKVNSKGFVSEANAQKVINDYNNKVFARNMGPASSTQKKFFKRFDMEGKLTEKPDMSYVEAKALIVDKLKEVGALDKDSAARISGYVDIPVMNYDVLYNVKPDVKEYAEILKNAKAICQDDEILRRQYMIDSVDSLKVTDRVSKLIYKSCKDYQEEFNKICSVADQDKLIAYVADKLIDSDLISYDGKTGKILDTEKQDKSFAERISKVLPKCFGEEGLKKCEKIVSKVRGAVQKSVSSVRSEVSRDNSGPALEM